MSIAAIVTAILGAIGGALAVFFGLIARKDRREGDEARALLGHEREYREALQNELDRRGIAIETPSERRESARLERLSRGVSDGSGSAS